MKWYLAPLSLCLFVPFLAFTFFAEGQPILPIACDEFGYLQLADGFGEGRALGSHTARPFDPALVSFLRNEGFDVDDYSFLVAPHAYHWDADAGMVVNQYPPATSYLLSWFPKSHRYAVFPGLCALLLVVPLLVVMWRRGSDSNRLFHLAIVFLAALACMFVPKIGYGFEHVNSFGPTYGILIAAGFALRRHPGLALALLGTSTLFRAANVVLAAPLLAWFVMHAKAEEGTPWNVKSAARASLRGGTLFGLGGFFGLLIYNWILLGSPLRTTYSQRDLDWTFAGIGRNFDYYFHSQAGSMWVHAVVLGLLVVAALGDRKLMRWALVALALCGFNYGFFLFHRVQIWCYPYATSLLALGMLLHVLDAHPKLELMRRQITVAAGLCLVCLLPLVRVPTLFTSERFADQVRVHDETLAEFDVVWAGIKSGTAEYTTHTAGFRYFWGPLETRIEVIRWLEKNGYSQAIWVDAPDFDRQTVVADLEAHDIEFVEKRTRLGPLLVIRDPAQTPSRGGR